MTTPIRGSRTLLCTQDLLHHYKLSAEPCGQPSCPRLHYDKISLGIKWANVPQMIDPLFKITSDRKATLMQAMRTDSQKKFNRLAKK